MWGAGPVVPPGWIHRFIIFSFIILFFVIYVQGLRTLELCVDNLQPDFLYEHIQPVRAELMQALWRTLRNRSDQIARVAFRVLGKLGGGNRKMLKEPQRVGSIHSVPTVKKQITITLSASISFEIVN